MNDDDDNDDFSLVCSSTSTSDDRFNLHVLYTHTPYFHICRLPKEVYTHTHTHIFSTTLPLLSFPFSAIFPSAYL